MQKQKKFIVALLILLTTAVILDNIPKSKSNMVCAVRESDELIYRVNFHFYNESIYLFERVQIEEYELINGTIFFSQHTYHSDYKNYSHFYEDVEAWESSNATQYEISTLAGFTEFRYFFPLDVNLQSIYQKVPDNTPIFFSFFPEMTNFSFERSVRTLKIEERIESRQDNVESIRSLKYDHRHILSLKRYTVKTDNIQYNYVIEYELDSATVTTIGVRSIVRMGIYSILLLAIVVNGGIIVRSAFLELHDRKIINEHLK